MRVFRGRSRATLAKRALVALAAALAVAAVVRVRARRREKAAVAELGTAVRGYLECLLGPPLERGETARARLRRIETGLPEPSLGAASKEDPWPLRCRADIDRAHAIILATPSLLHAPAAERLDGLLERARSDPAPEGAPDLISELVDAVPATGASAAARAYPPPSPHLAPEAASPLSAAALVPLPVHTRSFPDELPSTDPLSLWLTFVEPKNPGSTCAFTPRHGEPLREVTCTEARRGVVAIPHDSATEAPGYLRNAHGHFDTFEVVRPGTPESPNVVSVPGSALTAAIFGDQLLWVTSHHWYARTVTPGREPLGPVVDLGDVSGTSPELTACPTEGALVVGLKTFDDSLGERKSWRAIAARPHERDEWHRTPGSAVADVAATLTCEGHAATFTWWGRHEVHQVRCNADRCEARASGPVHLSWDVGGSLFTADLGVRALLLGLGTTPGPLLGRSVTSLRMRMAPLAALSAAPDVVLFSDQAHDGADLEGISVFVRDGVALVLLRGDDSAPYRALRLDSLGSFSPVTPGS